MVLQGYGHKIVDGLDYLETQRPKRERRRANELVGSWMVGAIMESKDYDILYAAFTSHPCKLSNVKTPDFIVAMGARIYTEWSHSFESRDEDHFMYDGEAFKKFIDDETWYAQGRLARMSLERPALAALRSAEPVRNQVLKATVQRAIDLFSDWGGYIDPQFDESGEPKDRRNLRESLESYLGF